MPKNSCIMQIWAESGKSAPPICNYSQILYQFLAFTQNLKRSRKIILCLTSALFLLCSTPISAKANIITDTYPNTPYTIQTVITDAVPSPNIITNFDRASHNITKTKTTYMRNSSGTVLWSVSITATFTYDGTTSRCISCSPSATAPATTWSIKSISSSKNGNSATAYATATHSSPSSSKDFTQSVTISCSKNGTIS